MTTASIMAAAIDEACRPRRYKKWTKGKREAFLDHLAATCNVAASAAVIGVHPASVYAMRRREPAFAAAWGVALTLGYQMIETRLVGRVLAGEAGDMPTEDSDPACGPIDVELAMKLLTRYRDPGGKSRPHGPKPKFAMPEETDAALMKKLAQIEARRLRDTRLANPPPASPMQDDEGKDRAGPDGTAEDRA